MKIVADVAIPFLEGVFEPYSEVKYMRGSDMGRSDVADADALIVRTRTRCDATLLEGSRVSMIASATIGSDHIDSAYCLAHGIETTTAAGCNAGAVLQWVAAALAETLRRSGRSPQGLTLGIVGAGNVGRLVMEAASGWGFTVVCSDPPREAAEGLGRADGFVPLAELARRADIVTFHVPLTRTGPCPTYRMAGREFFGLLRPGCTVLNSSRGDAADPEALTEAAESGRCTCVIDTWPGEPDIDPRLLKAAALATPHIAGYSVQGKARGTQAAVRAVARHFGLPLADWVPRSGVGAERRRISWQELCGTVRDYFDIAAETALLKSAPDSFERRRENYPYREEYF